MLSSNAVSSNALSVMRCCSGRFDNHVTTLVFALRATHNAVEPADRIVNHLTVSRRHWLQDATFARTRYLLRHLVRKPNQRLASALAVAANVNMQPILAVTPRRLSNKAGQFLDCLQGLTSRTDQRAEFVTEELDLEVAIVFGHVRRRWIPKCVGQAGEELLGPFLFVGPGRSCSCHGLFLLWRAYSVGSIALNDAGGPGGSWPLGRTALYGTCFDIVKHWLRLTGTLGCRGPRFRSRSGFAFFSRLRSATIAAFDLGPRLCGANSCPHAGLAAEASEQAGTWLFENLELRFIFRHTKLIKSLIFCFLDGSC
jgi:hypothetical protein